MNAQLQRVGYWEIIAANLSERELTRIAATESVSLCARMKSWARFWNSKQRFGPNVRLFAFRFVAVLDLLKLRFWKSGAKRLDGFWLCDHRISDDVQ